MRFLTLTLVACAAFGSAMADVSHLPKHYIPPTTMMMPPGGAGSQQSEMGVHSGLPITHMGRHTVTTIEKQELRELPTQTEYLQPGQTPYGVGVSKGNGYNERKVMPLGANGAEKPLAMMMPRELLPPAPPTAPLPSVEPKHGQEAPVVAPSNGYLAPEMNGVPDSRASQSNMPSRQYLTPPMMISEQRMEESPVASPSKQYLAPIMNISEQEEPEASQNREESRATAPSKQYLTPMTMQMQAKMLEEHKMNVPSKQYLASLPTMSAAQEEQPLPQQSAPAPRYLPPQQQRQMEQQTHEMPANQYLAPHMTEQEMQMQHSTEPPQRPAPALAPVTHYLPPSSMQMSRELPAREQTMAFASHMQPSREYLSPFGEGENVAEAAQEAAEMLNEPSVRQPMPPAAEEEPANYYLPPQSAAQPLTTPPQASETLEPVDFVRQHHQLMTQYEGVPEAPVSFSQFQSINSVEPNAEPMPAHFLADDGYHYLNGNSAAGRFRVRH
uniref:DUF4794 domain-containing protein n=1 Tax=Ceratitis capitata TaxID=7213 RepID=W8C1W2_CERCA